MGNILVALEVGIQEPADAAVLVDFIRKGRVSSSTLSCASGRVQERLTSGMAISAATRDGIDHRNQHHQDHQQHGGDAGQGGIVDRDAGPQGGAGKQAGGDLGQQVAQHHAQNGKGHGLGDEQKRDVGGRQPHRGVDADFPLAFVDAADHGVQDDEHRDDHGDQDVGHPAVAHGVAGVVEKGAVRAPR